MSYRKTASGANWSKRWTNRVFIGAIRSKRRRFFTSGSAVGLCYQFCHNWFHQLGFISFVIAGFIGWGPIAPVIEIMSFVPISYAESAGGRVPSAAFARGHAGAPACPSFAKVNPHTNLSTHSLHQ
jgi:hypothetical protein